MVWPRQWQAPWTKVRPRINHVAMHLLVPHLPFGGVGPSGMGAHHGEWGFQTMSHRKAVLAKTTKPDLKLLYPRYTEKGLKTMRTVLPGVNLRQISGYLGRCPQ